jgi:hypothetical protein
LPNLALDLVAKVIGVAALAIRIILLPVLVLGAQVRLFLRVLFWLWKVVWPDWIAGAIIAGSIASIGAPSGPGGRGRRACCFMWRHDSTTRIACFARRLDISLVDGAGRRATCPRRLSCAVHTLKRAGEVGFGHCRFSLR